MPIFALPYADGEFDGVYNPGGRGALSPPRHRQDAARLLASPEGAQRDVARCRAPLPALGFSSRTQLHPPEVSLLTGKRCARGVLEEAGFECAGFQYGFRDGFIQAVVVGRKPLSYP